MKARRLIYHLAVPTILLFILMPVTSLAAIHEIAVGDNFFGTPELTIEVGDTVRWVNTGSNNLHNVQSNDNAWTTFSPSNSFSFEVIFDTPGIFDYFCIVHQGSMTGTITVLAADGAELSLQTIDAGGGSYAPDDMISIESRIANTGTASSGAFSIDFYASEDDVISMSDQLLGSVNVADIAMGATLDMGTMVTVPESVDPGHYFIGAIISFSDSNAADNTNFDPNTVYFLGDLTINAGMNDLWVSDDADFQGFFFIVFPNINFVFISWFTFDSVRPDEDVTAVLGAPGQRWVTGGGLFTNNSVTINVELTTGGLFNTSEPPAMQQAQYGSMTIDFANCSEALLAYNFPDQQLSGQMIVHRVVDDNVPLCQLLNTEVQMMP